MALKRTPVIILRTSKVLTGALVAETPVAMPENVKRGLLRVRYTRGAAGRYPRIIVSDGALADVSTTPTAADMFPFAVASGTSDTENEEVRADVGDAAWQPFSPDGPSSGAETRLAIPLVLMPGGWLSVSCIEAGSAGAFGTLEVSFVGEIEQ